MNTWPFLLTTYFILAQSLSPETCASSQAFDCPAFICAESPSSVCANCNLESKLCTLSPCESKDMSCRDPRVWLLGEPVICQVWDEKKWDEDSIEDYLDVKQLNENEPCDPKNPKSICDYDDDLVCYCNGLCTCVEGLIYNDPCNESTKPCIRGYVCNNNKCVKKYSAIAGQEVTVKEACESGKTVEYDDKTICTNPPRTLGEIPKKCDSCKDCISSDGSEYSQCVCGVTETPSKYCHLHEGDQPWVDYRESISDLYFEREVYFEFKGTYYPYLQGDQPSCLDDVWKEYNEYEKGTPSKSGSVWLQLGIALALVTA